MCFLSLTHREHRDISTQCVESPFTSPSVWCTFGAFDSTRTAQNVLHVKLGLVSLSENSSEYISCVSSFSMTITSNIITNNDQQRTATPTTNRKQVPLTMAYCEDHHTLVTASADMTLLQWYLDDIPSIKHYTLKSRWPTKHAAMSMCWSSSHRLLYSGTTAGTIQGTFLE